VGLHQVPAAPRNLLQGIRRRILAAPWVVAPRNFHRVIGPRTAGRDGPVMTFRRNVDRRTESPASSNSKLPSKPPSMGGGFPLCAEHERQVRGAPGQVRRCRPPVRLSTGPTIRVQVPSADWPRRIESCPKEELNGEAFLARAARPFDLAASTKRIAIKRSPALRCEGRLTITFLRVSEAASLCGLFHFKPSVRCRLLARTRCSRQRSRMPTIEVESDCRRRRPPPPHLIRTRPCGSRPVANDAGGETGWL
jgi:hypothetical protein